MLDICPVSLAEANAFVAEHHRHHKPVVGHKFSIGCTDGEKIVGVAIVGNFYSRPCGRGDSNFPQVRHEVLRQIAER